MILSQLNINSLRNINSIKLSFNSSCNFFIGKNGCGKTSLLEAIYLLSTGRSFRTNKISPLVQYDMSQLTLWGKLNSNDSIALQKDINGKTIVKINQQLCPTASHLTKLFPCYAFYQDIFQIIDCGPSYRRQIIDWGLFHVKHSYLKLCQDYNKIVKQRNALLRKKAKDSEFVPWNEALVDLAIKINELREDYIESLYEKFNFYLQKLSDVPCHLTFYKGWDRQNKGAKLSQILAENLNNDRLRQHTKYGAHKADILLSSDNREIKQIFSRGQQKIILLALKLAQGAMLDKPCVYLFDDIASEMDEENLRKVYRCINEVEGQKFITATSRQDVINLIDEQKEFSVIDGRVEEYSSN